MWWLSLWSIEPGTLSDWAAIATALATVVYTLATIVVLVILIRTANYAKGQWDSAEKARQFACLCEQSRQWSSDLLREARAIVDDNRDTEGVFKAFQEGDLPSKDYFKLSALANYFEDLAILELEGQLTFDQVAERFSLTVPYYRRTLSMLITELQKDGPEVLARFVNLADRLEQRDTELGNASTS